MEQQNVDCQQAKEMKNAEMCKEEEIKKSLRVVKRHSGEKSSVPSEAGQNGIWPAGKRVC
jgi:hypothetical protein